MCRMRAGPSPGESRTGVNLKRSTPSGILLAPDAAAGRSQGCASASASVEPAVTTWASRSASPRAEGGPRGAKEFILPGPIGIPKGDDVDVGSRGELADQTAQRRNAPVAWTRAEPGDAQTDPHGARSATLKRV